VGLIVCKICKRVITHAKYSDEVLYGNCDDCRFLGLHFPASKQGIEDRIMHLRGHGLTHKQIAEQIGVTPQAISHRLRAIRARWEGGK